MKRIGMVLLGLAVSTCALAFDTYRVGARLVRVGDGASRLAEVVGEPAHKEPLETRAGGFIGERWQYRRDGKTVTFTIRDGKIAAIEEVRD